MNRWRTHGSPAVIAHRGHSVAAPEQTLAAFLAAITLGADMIEADVRRTADGRLVLMHDPTLERTTDGRGTLAGRTFAELRTLDAGSWFSSEFAGERIPSLDELFHLADERDIALCLEVKGEAPDERVALAHVIAREIQVRNRLDRDVLASFDHHALTEAAVSMPGLATAPDRLPERGPSSAAAIIEQARRCGAQIIQHHYADLSADVVDAVHDAGIAIWAWPPTTEAEVAESFATGVDGLMGDDVAVLSAAVGARQAVAPGDTATTAPVSAD